LIGSGVHPLERRAPNNRTPIATRPVHHFVQTHGSAESGLIRVETHLNQTITMRSSSAFFAFLVLLLLIPARTSTAQDLPDVTAEIQPASTIIVSGKWAESARSENDYRLEHMDGTPIPIADVLPRRSDEVLIVPGHTLDFKRLHRLHIEGREEPILVRRNDWFKTLYSSKPLGAIVSEDETTTTFRLFAPRAERVLLHLYLDRHQDLDNPEASINMTRDADGVWETEQAGNHHGVYYTFTVHGPDQPGNYFYETHPVHITDPYAFVSDDSFGKAMVFQSGEPPAPVSGGRPPMEDVVAYEVHVQDFTDRLPLPDNLKGTMLGMVEPGLTNEHGAPIGFDHLLDLGINVVHLMPVQEYLHYPDDEWQEAFADDPYMQEQGVATENYQWGYRTTHAFAVESRFRSQNASIGAERDEFKQLVDAFHREGISVIIDVVPNHTGENMDGRHYLFNFNAIDLPYYYRTDANVEHIGPFGNETRPEDRPMVQRWMLDQLRHWVDELGVDGFRIDLAGQIDEQTLAWIKEELPEDLIIYGEAWIAPTDPVTRADPDLFWYKADAPITYFQDDARNAFKGPVSNPSDPAVDRGFAGGDGSQREKAMMGLMNSFPEEVDPNRGINYLDIHDNWALADRFSDQDWDGRMHVDEAGVRLAATLLFTSLGPLVVHGGTEMLRSKGAAPLMEIVKTSASGDLAYHGKRDTYNHRRANQFEWEYAGAEPWNRPIDYAAMTAYWKRLISLRSSESGSVFRMGGSIPKEHYQWFLPENDQLLGYVAGSEVLVLMNTSWEAATFDITTLPAGTWTQVSDGGRFQEDGCSCEQSVTVPAESTGESIQVTIQSRSAPIWVRQQD
jgi:pullulanase/glycogen debranching enzyme